MPIGNISDVKEKLHGLANAAQKADDTIDNKVSAYYQSKQKEGVKGGTGK